MLFSRKKENAENAAREKKLQDRLDQSELQIKSFEERLAAALASKRTEVNSMASSPLQQFVSTSASMLCVLFCCIALYN